MSNVLEDIIKFQEALTKVLKPEDCDSEAVSKLKHDILYNYDGYSFDVDDIMFYDCPVYCLEEDDYYSLLDYTSKYGFSQAYINGKECQYLVKGTKVDFESEEEIVESTEYIDTRDVYICEGTYVNGNKQEYKEDFSGICEEDPDSYLSRKAMSEFENEFGIYKGISFDRAIFYNARLASKIIKIDCGDWYLDASEDPDNNFLAQDVLSYVTEKDNEKNTSYTGPVNISKMLPVDTVFDSSTEYESASKDLITLRDKLFSCYDTLEMNNRFEYDKVIKCSKENGKVLVNDAEADILGTEYEDFINYIMEEYPDDTDTLEVLKDKGYIKLYADRLYALHKLGDILHDGETLYIFGDGEYIARDGNMSVIF